ncbi:hypothetical protein PSCICO_32010 [Pseudomonas cichorii]|uniref:hypothetical protein n=1 Tax=Pseudomonas cichorii TaxID=36746 RepID=UPI0019111CB3|nr:hypothetical protein [Pseudomonas cichorii]GFM87802.1 hypothetical protein PSCICO_32010 [Pseudomonas cichorii]
MEIESHGPESAYPGPAEKTTDTGEGHGSDLEQTQSEPKQGGDRPEDWNPPPGNPGSGDDAQADQENDDEPKTDSLIDAE